MHTAFGAKQPAPDSGMIMTITTKQPGVQIASCGQSNAPIPAKQGRTYRPFAIREF
jgi:hypothetical protein